MNRKSITIIALILLFFAVFHAFTARIPDSRNRELPAFTYAGADVNEYNAAKDYDSSNPNDVWSYGSIDDGEFSLLASKLADPNISVSSLHSGEVERFYVNKTGSALKSAAGVLYEPNKMILNPAQNGAPTVLRFTVPEAGEYTITGSFTAIDEKGDEVVVSVYQGDKELTKATLSAVSAGLSTLKKSISINNKISLFKGDTLDFIVSPGEKSGNDTVELVLIIIGIS